MKHISFALLLAAALFASCESDTAITDIRVPGTDYTLPQGGDTSADAKAMQMYEDYGSFVLYDFTERDFQWTLVSQEGQYQFTPLAPSAASGLIDVVRATWTDLYPKAFLQHYMPKFVFLTGKLQMWKDEGWFGGDWVDIPARYLTNQIAIAATSTPLAEMTPREKRTEKSYLNSVFLQYCLQAGAFAVPAEFYTLSDYSGWGKDSGDEAREAGFLYNPQDENDWSVDAWSLSKDEDLRAYLASLAYLTDAEWAPLLEHSLVREKRDILVSAITAAGIDISAIGNMTYE